MHHLNASPAQVDVTATSTFTPIDDSAFQVCLHTDAVPGGADFCCPGSPLCATFFP